MFSRVITFVALGALARAAPTLFPRAASIPSEDPFYTQPSNISAYNPGDIINSRPTPGPIGAAPNYTSLNIQGAYQLLYRTQDALGNPTAAVTTVLVPYNAQYDKLLSYQTAYDSSDVNCSPSYTLQQSSNETSYDPILIATALDQGWVVTTTDYEGLQAEFVAGLTEGYATLDAVRATLGSNAITGVLGDATLGLWGYSGGALACEWALEVQPDYASELHFVGAALGGLTPNVTDVLNRANGTQFSTLAFSGINGLAKAYPNFTDYLDTHLVPAKAAAFRSADLECTPGADRADLADQDVYSYFTNGDAALADPVPASVIMWGATMGYRATPRPPLYVYKAIQDEVSGIAYTDALVAEYCARGASIEYVQNTVGEHVTEAILGSWGAWGWMIDRMNGQAAPTGCTTSTVTVTGADVDSFEGFTDEVIGGLKAVLSLPLGPFAYQGISAS